jgi:hypothetical protein
MLNQLRNIYFKNIQLSDRARLRLYQAHHLRGPQHVASRVLFGSNLRALAAFYGTDKWSDHNYADVYSTLFKPLRKRRLNILEIGVGGYDDPYRGGGSLRMWRTYFLRGRVFAVDIADKSPHDERRIRTFRGSQDDERFLNEVADRIGRLDLVIDDGSHICRHVIKSFEVLFPRLAPGGLYIVEDTQTSYREDHEGSSTDLGRPGTTMNYFRRLIDGVNSREIQKVNAEYVPSEIEGTLSAIGFFEKMIVLRKTP